MSGDAKRLEASVEFVPATGNVCDDVVFDGYVVARFGPVANCPLRKEVGLVVRPRAQNAVDGASFSLLGPRRLAAMLKTAVEEELARHRGAAR